jgi:hypothetical protein
MAKRIKWEPKLIENVRNEDFNEEDFNLLLEELATFVLKEMHTTNPNDETATDEST